MKDSLCLCHQKMTKKPTIPNTDENIHNLFNQAGYLVHAIERPISGRSPVVNFTCNRGHTRSMRVDVFKSGSRCRICKSSEAGKAAASKTKRTVEQAKARFAEKGFQLVGEYIDGTKLVDVLCPNEHLIQKRLNSLLTDGKGCHICYLEKREAGKLPKEYYKVYKQQWHKENAERIARKAAVRYRQNKEAKQEYDRIRLAQIRHTKRFKDLVRLNAQRRRARLQECQSENIGLAELEKRMDLFGRCCAYCGDDKGKLTVDHFIPISKGGGHVLLNIIPCCSSCNSSKSNRNPFDWYSQQEFFDWDKWFTILNNVGISDTNGQIDL